MSRPRILDPHAVPVDGHDGHLPPLDLQWLQPEGLRQRFGQTANWAPELAGDGHPHDGTETSTAAAVLVPLVMRPLGLQVLLTRRTDHLRDHPGQISFPGGRSEPGDADAVATALRETEEEVGLQRRHIEIVGRLPDYRTITGYQVTPVVGLVSPGFELKLDSFEVAEAFEVPLQFLMTPAHHRRHALELAGQRRQFLSMPWRGDDPSGVAREYFIWGATAAMLRNLYRFLAQAV